MNVRLVVHPVRRPSPTDLPGNARPARLASWRLGRAPRWPLALGLAGLLGGCAGVDPFGPQPLAGAAQSAVQGRGNVDVRLDPAGVATVSGWVEDRISELAVLREVGARAEVARVVDLIRVEDFHR